MHADPDLRAMLRDLLIAILRADDAVPSPSTDAVDAGVATDVAVMTPSVQPTAGEKLVESGPRETEPLREMVLRIGDAQSSVHAVAPTKSPEASGFPIGTMGPQVVSDAPAPMPVAPAPSNAELRPCAQRCRLKASGCRWAIERRRLLQSEEAEVREAITARDRELFSQAKSFENCYLWMMDPRGPSLPEDDALLETLAGCYDAAADAAELVLLVDAAAEPAGDAAQDALRLLAESLSALRFGLTRVDRSLEDYDQRELFLWLRDQTSRRHVYVARHMRLDDPADPDRWLGRSEDIARVRQSLEKRKQSESERRQLLGKVRFHAKKAASATADADADSEWRKVASAVEQLVGNGMMPSDRELRELLLPHLDDLPELDYGPNMRAVLDEADRYLERLGQEQERDQDGGAPAKKFSPTVDAARQLLTGRVAVLVGGYPREQQRRKIEQALGLAELRWVSVLHHQSLEEALRNQFLRSETSVFFTMTRFRSHAIGPQMRQWCKQFGKVYVELPAGYGTEQVAHQVMEQASGQLAPTASAAQSSGFPAGQGAR